MKISDCYALNATRLNLTAIVTMVVFLMLSMFPCHAMPTTPEDEFFDVLVKPVLSARLKRVLASQLMFETLRPKVFVGDISQSDKSALNAEDLRNVLEEFQQITRHTDATVDAYVKENIAKIRTMFFHYFKPDAVQPYWAKLLADPVASKAIRRYVTFEEMANREAAIFDFATWLSPSRLKVPPDGFNLSGARWHVYAVLYGEAKDLLHPKLEAMLRLEEQETRDFAYRLCGGHRSGCPIYGTESVFERTLTQMNGEIVGQRKLAFDRVAPEVARLAVKISALINRR